MLVHDCHLLLAPWVPHRRSVTFIRVYNQNIFALPFSEFLSFDLGLGVRLGI